MIMKTSCIVLKYCPVNQKKYGIFLDQHSNTTEKIEKLEQDLIFGSKYRKPVERHIQ